MLPAYKCFICYFQLRLYLIITLYKEDHEQCDKMPLVSEEDEESTGMDRNKNNFLVSVFIILEK